MQANDITPERLRRLAGIRAGDAKVLSLFVNLDPREFATPAARRTEVRSLLDRAARRVRDEDGLSHAAQASLRSDLERLEAELGARRPGRQGRARPGRLHRERRSTSSRSSSCRSPSNTTR